MERLEQHESVHRLIEGALGHLWFVHNDYTYHREVLTRDIATYKDSNPSYGTYLEREIAHLEAQVEKARRLTEAFLQKTLPHQLRVSGVVERCIADDERQVCELAQDECRLTAVEVVKSQNDEGAEGFVPIVHLVHQGERYRGVYRDIDWEPMAAHGEVA